MRDTVNSILHGSPVELHEMFRALIKQLYTLRLAGVYLRPGPYSWDNPRETSWDHALPTDVIKFLASDSTIQSIEIRNLKSRKGSDLPNVLPAIARSLKRLRLDTMDSVALYSLLNSISPGPYDMSLSIPARFALSSRHNEPPLNTSSSIPRNLGSLLRKFSNITRLTLTSSMNPPSRARCENMHMLLKNLHNLHHLGLVDFRLTQQITVAMTRPYEQEPATMSNNTFSMLRELRLQGTCILDYDAFKAMIFSHPVSRLCISHCKLEWDGDNPTAYPTPSSPLHKWLSAVVPTIEIAWD
ncbi:unnamed protein product [Rhizoctonia solani]|uniref:F-box domain-containing protein n=1 Tax=Rhizoctonia solani TaxID=456999 RepID=A0A8H2X5F9_9AGAM|nr:unnamed protein product [Rhizoctonia solani]